MLGGAIAWRVSRPDVAPAPATQELVSVRVAVVDAYSMAYSEGGAASHILGDRTAFTAEKVVHVPHGTPIVIVATSGTSSATCSISAPDGHIYDASAYPGDTTCAATIP